MKKIMEIYQEEGTFIFKQPRTIYHLFVGVEEKEDVTSVKVANEIEAVNFMFRLFNNLKLITKEKTIIKDDTAFIEKHITCNFKVN